MNPNDKPPPRDYRQEVTDEIIRLLEQGTAPWQKPWTAGEAGRMSYNPTTNNSSDADTRAPLRRTRRR